METLHAVFTWLLRASWQASVLVGLVLVTQWLLRKKLSPGWRYALWLLVLIRLVMPASPQSPVSVFNLSKIQFTSSAGPKIQRDNDSTPAPSVLASTDETKGQQRTVGPRAPAVEANTAVHDGASAIPITRHAPRSTLRTLLTSLPLLC